MAAAGVATSPADDIGSEERVHERIQAENQDLPSQIERV